MDAVQIGFLVVMVGLVVMETVLGGGLSRPRECLPNSFLKAMYMQNQYMLVR